MKIDLSTISIRKAHEDLKNRIFSASDLTDAYLSNIKAKNKNLNVFLEVFEKDARAQAENVDHIIKNSSRIDLEKRLNLLAGIPIALKDNILVDGKLASGGSKILENYVATYDSTVVAKLKKAEAVILGRTNMDEFAMGGSTENSAYGVTKNPHDNDRVPGGSSGGSAVAVSADLSLVALGSDTGGSVRQPASFCGIVGMKPTYGAISRHGLMAMASSLDQIGPMTKSVDDAEILFEAIRGEDASDSTTLPSNHFRVESLPTKLRIGVPYDFLKEGVDVEVLSNFNQTLATLKSLGHEIVPVNLPYIKYSLAVYYILMPAEASTNLARYDGVRYGLHVDGANSIEDYFKTRAAGFGPEVRRRIILGSYVLSAGYYDAYYKKACAVRNLISRDFERVFSGDGQIAPVHAVLTPTSPTPAFKIGEKSDPLSMYLADIFTVPSNIAGVPSISVPTGSAVRDGKKLPLGTLITTSRGREDIMFGVAKVVNGEISQHPISL